MISSAEHVENSLYGFISSGNSDNVLMTVAANLALNRPSGLSWAENTFCWCVVLIRPVKVELRADKGRRWFQVQNVLETVSVVVYEWNLDHVLITAATNLASNRTSGLRWARNTLMLWFWSRRRWFRLQDSRKLQRQKCEDSKMYCSQQRLRSVCQWFPAESRSSLP